MVAKKKERVERRGFACYQPELQLRCTWCGRFFLCGDAPHDEEGCLCPGCGRGEDLEVVRGGDGASL